MNINSFVSTVLKNEWLIDIQYAFSQLPLLEQMLRGNSQSATTKIEFATFSAISEIGTGTAAVINRMSDITEPSIFRLDIRGPITKETGPCGEAGTREYIELIRQAKQHKMIEGLFIRMDSPGGEAHAVPTLAEEIRTFGKPTVGFIHDGYAASGGYWPIAAATKVISSHKINKVGSIGAMTSFMSMKTAMEKAGIKFEIINAPQSEEKNKAFLDAYNDGNFDLIKEELRYLAQIFIDSIAELRGERLKDVKGMAWNKGRLFNSEEALQIGLIDAIGDEDFALTELVNLINQNKTPTTMFGNKHPEITALVNVAEEKISDETINEINTSFDNKDISGIRVVKTSWVKSAEDSVAEISKLKNEIKAETTLKAAAENKVKDLEAKVETLTKESSEWKEKAEAYGEQPGAMPTNPAGKSETEEKSDDKSEKVISKTDEELAALKANMQQVKV